MRTILLKMKEEAPDPEGIALAGRILRGGGLVAFPTETVYGLGGDALLAASSNKIYEAKGRPSDNPLIVHICEIGALDRIVSRIPDAALRLAEAFWPGPLTMIMEKTDAVPYETTGGLDTVAVRFPRNRIAQELIRAGGGYIAAPSANRSGRPSPTLAAHCLEDLDGLVDMIIDGGPVGLGLESTIVDLTQEEPAILRPGFVTQEMLEEVLGEVSADKGPIPDDSAVRPKAPGMKYRHYAPRGELTVVEGDTRDAAEYIKKELEAARRAGRRTGVICTRETAPGYRDMADCIRITGERGDEEAAARELFRILRDFDADGTEVIFSEAFPESGLGEAVMNRLCKAAGNRVIRLGTDHSSK